MMTKILRIIDKIVDNEMLNAAEKAVLDKIIPQDITNKEESK